jgi:hypothetical protein
MNGTVDNIRHGSRAANGMVSIYGGAAAGHFP